MRDECGSTAFFDFTEPPTILHGQNLFAFDSDLVMNNTTICVI